MLRWWLRLRRERLLRARLRLRLPLVAELLPLCLRLRRGGGERLPGRALPDLPRRRSPLLLRRFRGVRLWLLRPLERLPSLLLLLVAPLLLEGWGLWERRRLPLPCPACVRVVGRMRGGGTSSACNTLS